MGTASLISALLLGLVGLMAILFCLRLLLSGLLGPGKGLIQRARIRYREKLAENADNLIKQESYEKAAAILRQAFYSEGIGKDLQLVDRLTNLNLSILGRLLIVAEKRSVQLENLAVVEDLILSRGQLMKALIEKRRLAQGVAPATTSGAEPPPEWARQQFVKLYSELKDRLSTNQRSLDSQFGILLEYLSRARQAEEVRYH